MDNLSGRPTSAQQLDLIASVAGSSRDVTAEHHPRALWIIGRILEGWTLDQIVAGATDGPWVG